MNSEIMIRGKGVLTLNPREHFGFPVLAYFELGYLIIIIISNALFKMG